MQRLGELGIDFGQFLTGLADMLRAQLAVTLGSTSIEGSERARAALLERRERISAGDLLRMLSALGELEQRFRKSGQQQLLLETLLIRFALIDRSVSLEDVLRGLGDGGSSGSGIPRPPAPPSTGGAPSRSSGSFRSGPADDSPRRAASESSQASAVADRPVTPPIARDLGRAPRSSPSGSSGSSATATLAPPAPRVAMSGVPTINVVSERWDDVVEALRANRMLLAPFLEQAVPSAISAAGVLTIRTDDVAAADALETGKTDMLSVVKTFFPAIDRINIVRPESAPAAGAARRVTEEEIRAQRMATLRKRDPVLGAAIDALDLELLD